MCAKLPAVSIFVALLEQKLQQMKNSSKKFNKIITKFQEIKDASMS